MWCWPCSNVFFSALFTTKPPRMEIKCKMRTRRHTRNYNSTRHENCQESVFILFPCLILSQPVSDHHQWTTSHSRWSCTSVCVIAIPGLPCSSKYLFVSETEMRQVEEEEETMFSGERYKSARVCHDCLLWKKEKWFYQTYAHTPCKSLFICYNPAPDELIKIIKFQYIIYLGVFHKWWLARVLCVHAVYLNTIIWGFSDSQ